MLTGETTVPGAPKPDTWIEVVDKRTGLIYYWCKRTGDTTVLGEPKPGPYGRKAQFDAPDEEAAALEEGGGGGGRGVGGGGRGGGGTRGGGGDGGPSLMRLVSNPLVVGVSALALAGIAYESLFK
ncbi:hypothetical protein GPECTOR_20g473 [Gonium pectorale]|uniref:WW domain-containing protein n=1 Tax=Gonium pectorale TaxID=33097 RepID=A0A150GIG6_GONPE|nr:hypothetical protein GPECTOR_20g473 [Gonium pectorale]|eukprot:KXZ49616.1 hypothetical protein GPECTOR_20g473 [Gonium pectorale]